MIALKIVTELETQVQQMEQKLQKQQKQSAIQVQVAKVEQDKILQKSAIEVQVAREAQAKIVQQLEETQKAAQSMITHSQQYESQLAEVTKKMNTLEQLLIAQRQRSGQLESELSAA